MKYKEITPNVSRTLSKDLHNTYGRYTFLGFCVFNLYSGILDVIGLAWNALLTVAVLSITLFMCKIKSSFPMDEEEEPEYEIEKKM